MSWLAEVGDRLRHGILANRPNPLRLTKAALLIAAWLGIVGYLAIEIYSFVRLASLSEKTEGTVESISTDVVEPDSGGGGPVDDVRYRFVVEGRTFYGEFSNAYGRSAEGDLVSVEYDPRNPARNRLEGDRESLGNAFILSILVWLGFLFVKREYLSDMLAWWKG